MISLEGSICNRLSSFSFALHDILIAPKAHFLFISYSSNIFYFFLFSVIFFSSFDCTFLPRLDVRGCYQNARRDLPLKNSFFFRFSHLFSVAVFFWRNMMFNLRLKFFSEMILIYTTSRFSIRGILQENAY